MGGGGKEKIDHCRYKTKIMCLVGGGAVGGMRVKAGNGTAREILS